MATKFLLRFLGLILILAAILFGAAGRLDWLQGWLFTGFFAALILFYGAWSLRHDPALLEERSRTGANTKSWDKVILQIYTALLLGMLVLSGLDAGRFGWAPAPPGLQLASWCGLLFSGAWIGWVSAVNTFLSRTVRIQTERGHQVVQSGPYRSVRHPMYAGLILFVVCAPLALGSRWGLVPGALIAVLMVIRTALEDRALQAELPGYTEYARQVRYRLIPGVW